MAAGGGDGDDIIGNNLNLNMTKGQENFGGKLIRGLVVVLEKVEDVLLPGHSEMVVQEILEEAEVGVRLDLACGIEDQGVKDGYMRRQAIKDKLMQSRTETGTR